MAQALQDILTELNSVYQPQKDAYNQQITALDPQMQADQAGLDAAKTDSFNQISTDANRRGLAYSGIPISEQAQYTGSTYLPSVANLKSQYAQQRFNLQNALAQVGQTQYNTAYGIQHQQAQDDAAKIAASASAGSGFSPTFGGGDVPGDSTNKYAQEATGKATQRAGGGFNFTDPNGNGLSAAQYAKAANIPFRDLLSWMAAKGDTGAKQALQFVGNDYGYNPNTIGGNGSLYNALVNGVTQYRGSTSNIPGLTQAGQQSALPANLKLSSY